MRCHGSTPVNDRALFLQQCRVEQVDDRRHHQVHTADALLRELHLLKPQDRLTLA
jgi:hypothetical protein